MKSEILSLLRESMLREKAADAPAGETSRQACQPAKSSRQAGNIYRARSFAAVLGYPERLSGK